jgi:glycosyltransferase involved in cell wall biosynthesis
VRRRRKLLSLGHSYVVTMNRRLAHELARVDSDWDVTAAAPRYFQGDYRPERLQPRADELCRVVPLDAYGTERVHLFVYGPSLRPLLSEGWDLVHCWEEPYILAGGQLAWWAPRKTPLVFRTAQSLDKRYPPPFNWVERFAMSRAAGWICSGRLVAGNLKRRAGYGDLPMAQIPLGVDLAAFRPDPGAGRATRERLGWSADGPPVVGYIGRFVPEKGLRVLQQALDAVSEPWRALFLGGGSSEGELRAWAQQHGDRVRIASVTHDQVPAYLNAMDVVCAPSQTTAHWKEQFGRMVVEAFAAGVAFVGSDSGEIPYVVRDNGLIVGEADVAGWTRAISELLGDPARRRELGARGLDRASAEFAWPAVARRYIEFFDGIAASRGDRLPNG